MSTFQIRHRDARALRGCGWTCFDMAPTAMLRVQRDSRAWHAVIKADGSWEISRRRPLPVEVVAQGMDSLGPCGAAADCNEIMWALRDGRALPVHLLKHLVRNAT